jgi:hypothetical protein
MVIATTEVPLGRVDDVLADLGRESIGIDTQPIIDLGLKLEKRHLPAPHWKVDYSQNRKNENCRQPQITKLLDVRWRGGSVDEQAEDQFSEDERDH